MATFNIKLDDGTIRKLTEAAKRVGVTSAMRSGVMM